MVECTGLENRRGLTPTVGSNPTSSAILLAAAIYTQTLAHIRVFLRELLAILKPLLYLLIILRLFK